MKTIGLEKGRAVKMWVKKKTKRTYHSERRLVWLRKEAEKFRARFGRVQLPGSIDTTGFDPE